MLQEAKEEFGLNHNNKMSWKEKKQEEGGKAIYVTGTCKSQLD